MLLKVFRLFLAVVIVLFVFGVMPLDEVSLALTRWEKVVVYIFLLMAFVAIFELDKIFLRIILDFLVFLGKKAEKRKICLELDRLVPGWNWREKGLKFKPLKK